MSPYNAVLLIAFGGPEKFEDVRPFLANVLRGRPVPPERIETVVEQYRAIGGRSPLNEITVSQALALAGKLTELRLSLPVYIGMRNWTPYLRETLERMREDGVYRAFAIIMAPHRSPASWEKYRDAAEQARADLKAADAPELVYVPAWHEHPLFIEAIADRVKAAGAPDDAAWIFTAHSIPVEQDRVSDYSGQMRRTAELVARALGKKEWHIAFQSRSGNPQEEWLEPDIGDRIAELAAKGARSALAIPVGFVCDHVEVLFDLDIKARKAAEERGIRFFRAKTVEDHPRFIEMLAGAVADAVERESA